MIDARNAEVIGDETLVHQGEVGGFVTSGGFAHASGVSVAMGYVRAELADEPEGWCVELFAEMLDARMQKQPLFDSNSSRMRS